MDLPFASDLTILLPAAVLVIATIGVLRGALRR